MVSRPADDAVLPATQEMPIHTTPVFIAIDTTSAAVSRPAGDQQMSASESDADGDPEGKAA